MTIRSVLIFNNYGRPRLTKFYSRLPTDRQQALIQLIFQIVSRRDESQVCNFLDAPELTPFLPLPTGDAWSKMRKEQTLEPTANQDDDLDPWIEYDEHDVAPKSAINATPRRWRPDDELRVIYRHYATLYFVMVVDQSESELGILDLIQVLVEALDQSFENVCELDLIFHFEDINAIVDQIIQGGLVLETNLSRIVAATHTAQQARKNQAHASALAPNTSAWTSLTLNDWAERGTDALGYLQQFGSQYWQAIQANNTRPTPLRSRFL